MANHNVVFVGGKWNEPPQSLLCKASSPKGTPFVVEINVPVATEAVPLGKVAANGVSRRKGEARRECFRRKPAQQLPFAVMTPSCENALSERPQTLRQCSIKIIFLLNMRKANAERSSNRPAGEVAKLHPRSISLYNHASASERPPSSSISFSFTARRPSSTVPMSMTSSPVWSINWV